MQNANKDTDCIYCNGAPVNHTLEYFFSIVDNLLPKIFAPFYNLTKYFGFLSYFANILIRIFTYILIKTGVIRFSRDESRVITERTLSIWQEAHRRGILVEQMILLGKPMEECRMWLQPKGYKKAKWFYFHSLPTPPWKEPSGHIWIDDKTEFHKVFIKEGLPVAKSIEATSWNTAKDALHKITPPVIVKPISGSRARHTTVNIHNDAHLKEGFSRAKMISHKVLIEEYVTGDLHRATCIDSKLIGVIRFVKPEVIADGKRNILELLEYHNENKKYPQMTDVKIDQWFYDAIAHQGYNTRDIPKAGTQILLSEHSERPNGGYFVDITDSIPKENVDIIEHAAKVVDLAIVGFDIISHDLTAPYSNTRFVFIEGNSLPFIELHQVLFEGKVRDTPRAVMDMWF